MALPDTGDGSNAVASSALERLPTEIAASISSFLPNRDIKSLRLTNGAVCGKYRLRLGRVFLSPNPRNIEVFRAIAGHDVFRTAVVEIIWDDALLAIGPRNDGNDYERGLWDSEPEADEEEDVQQDHPSWFAKACHYNIEELEFRIGDDVPRPDQIARMQQAKEQMPLDLAWAHYQVLLQQQDEMLSSRADAEALRYGLTRFPSLKKFHHHPGRPWAAGWPIHSYGDEYELPPWNENLDSAVRPWRGFSYVMSELAGNEQRQQHRISELVVNVQKLQTGINCRVFDEPLCLQYNQLAALLRCPGFRRLDLALQADGEYWQDWPCLRNGLLHRALVGATDLQHLHIGAYHDLCQFEEFSEPGDPKAARVYTPLRTMLPLHCWPRLRHLGLCDLLLPPSLESVELGFLWFLDGGTYGGLLDDMRSTLRWHELPEEGQAKDRLVRRQRPRVIVNLRIRGSQSLRYINADREVHEFLYRGGENAFIWEGKFVSSIRPRAGLVCDPFDLAYERPDVANEVLMKMGIVKRNEAAIEEFETFERMQRERREREQQAGAASAS